MSEHTELTELTPKMAVDLWGAGFAIAGIGQVIMNRRIARNSRWGRSGWQREVIIWNVGTVTSLAALRRMPEDPDRALTIGFTTLSTLFALNHVRALTSEKGGGTTTHLEALALNLVGIGVGLGALRQ